MERVLLFFDRPYIEAHFCYKELVIQLANNGFKVDLFYINAGTIPRFNPSLNIKLVPFSMNLWGTFRILCRLLAGNFVYKAVIANPQWPLYWAYKCRLFNSYKIVCLSDEVFALKESEYSVYQKLYKATAGKWKKREIYAHRKCDATIALGEQRYDLVKEINGLSRDHIYFIVPNAPPGRLVKDSMIKNNFYRKKFNLSKRHILLLHSGGLGWSFVSHLFNIIFNDIKIKLILQTRRNYDIIDSSPSIIISNDFVEYENIVFVSTSADIGLMLYDKNNPEESRNGPTAGKLGLYLAAELPVIACNLPDLQWIEDEKCGIRIESLNDLEAAVVNIMNNYGCYQENARRVYWEKFEYSAKFQHFCEWLKK